jgi:hypothetical protein
MIWFRWCGRESEQWRGSNQLLKWIIEIDGLVLLSFTKIISERTQHHATKSWLCISRE